jgi:hypothetical protein
VSENSYLVLYEWDGGLWFDAPRPDENGCFQPYGPFKTEYERRVAIGKFNRGIKLP